MPKHCCSMMKQIVQSPHNALIDYEDNTRSYAFFVKNDPRGTRQEMSFFPWCGTKLPEDLGEKWAEVIKQEFGYDDPFYEPVYDNLPEEFRTDAWWKKRGL